MSVEVTSYYCVGEGVEVAELEGEVGGSGGCGGDVDVDDVELLFVELDADGLKFECVGGVGWEVSECL